LENKIAWTTVGKQVDRFLEFSKSVDRLYIQKPRRKNLEMIDQFVEKSELVNWFYKNSRHSKRNSKCIKTKVPHDSRRRHMDLRVAGIWYFGSSSICTQIKLYFCIFLNKEFWIFLCFFLKFWRKTGIFDTWSVSYNVSLQSKY
jgi:hypothetical protein